MVGESSGLVTSHFAKLLQTGSEAENSRLCGYGKSFDTKMQNHVEDLRWSNSPKNHIILLLNINSLE